MDKSKHYQIGTVNELTYRFYNTKTKTEYEDLMSISEMEEFIKQKHIKLMPLTKVNIVSSTGGIDSKTDSGWKDTLSKISEKHPNSSSREIWIVKVLRKLRLSRQLQNTERERNK